MYGNSEKGRLIVMIIWGAELLLALPQILGVLLSGLVIGIIVYFGIIGLWGYFLYKGSWWTRWFLLGTYGVGIVSTVSDGIVALTEGSLAGLVLFSLAAVYIFVFGVILFSEDVRAHFGV